MEVEQETNSFQHEEDDGLDESLDQTGFLLQRLQELQAWQQEQEMQLLREQEQQIGRLVQSNHQVSYNSTLIYMYEFFPTNCCKFVKSGIFFEKKCNLLQINIINVGGYS